MCGDWYLSQVSRADKVVQPDGSLDTAVCKQIMGEPNMKYADIVGMIHRPEYYQRSETPCLNKNIAEIHFIKNEYCDRKLIKLTILVNMSNSQI